MEDVEEEGWCSAKGMRRARWCSMSLVIGVDVDVDGGSGGDVDEDDVDVDSVRSAVDGCTCCLYWNSRAGVVFALALVLVGIFIKLLFLFRCGTSASQLVVVFW